MNRHLHSGMSLLGALPFALLFLVGLAAVFGPRKMNALQWRVRRRTRRWVREEYPVIRRRVADDFNALRHHIHQVAKVPTGLPKE